MNKTLVVNKSYLPLHVVHWKKAINLICRERAELVEFYPDGCLRSENDCWEFPAVVRLTDFDFPPKGGKMYQHLNKHNIWLRDGGRCVYCDEELSTRTMTMDHVKPKSLGGKKTWDNLVCSCRTCNGKKGNRSLSEAKMKLSKSPYAPTLNNSMALKVKRELSKFSEVPKTWKKYLFWVKA